MFIVEETSVDIPPHPGMKLHHRFLCSRSQEPRDVLLSDPYLIIGHIGASGVAEASESLKLQATKVI